MVLRSYWFYRPFTRFRTIIDGGDLQASYRQLISEHEHIEACATALLADISDDTLPATDIAVQMSELATAVNVHIEVEEGIVSSVDHDRLTGPWTAAWVEGEAAFQRLRSDWIAFLDRWDAPSIDHDRAGFVRAAQAILGRLRDRLSIETRAFYATALQAGSIALR